MNREDLRSILRVVAVALIIIGFILLLDEAWMFGYSIGGFLGDWSAFHIEPLHHWMWGIIMIYAGIGIIMADKMEEMWKEV